MMALGRLLLLLLGLVGGAVELAAFDGLSPQRLRCEYLENPLGIDAPAPRLSWIVNGAGRARRQTAYRLLVAHSEAALRLGRGDLWDSGKIVSSSTGPVSYAGPALGSATRVWWSVRVWDEADRPSAWSVPAWWETALLDGADWHGQWIARAAFSGLQTTPPTRPPLLRRDFILDGPVKRARVYVTGLGYFELSINGARVGDHLLDPGFTRYDRRVLYVTHDVTAALRRGGNTLGVMLGNGWFNVETRAAWDFEAAPWRATPRLLLELRVEYEDGRTAMIASDQEWKTADSPITFSSIYGGENYDARLEWPGWDAPGFDDRAWNPALRVDAPKGRLAAQTMPPIRLDRVIAPVAVTEPAPGVFVFDAGQNLAGNAELVLAAPAGTTLTLRYGEGLTPEGRVDQADSARFVKRADASQQFQTDTYTFKGAGVERWHSRFNYHGFRYVEVTGAPGRLTADNLVIRYFHTDVALVGGFACSNPLLNRIWENGRWSYLSNLFGLPTDCPHREKNGWTGDAHIACEQGMLYADGITVYEKWIRDMADEQFITGALPGIVPTSGQWGYRRYCGPAWDSAFLLVPWYLYEYYGDDSLLRANFAGYKKYVDYLTSQACEGVVNIGLGDWNPWKTRTPEAVTDTGYYYRDARMVATIARWLGQEADARKYDALADAIKRAFNEAFYDDATGSYSVGSQTALGCALYLGLTEPENEARVLDALVAAVERNDGHLDFGLLGSKYVLNALSARGRTDVAYTIASQKTQPGWGWWIGQGATTLWENWTGAESHNHTFFGDVNAWMVKFLAGIQPDPTAPGFKRIVIAPNPVGDLASASGYYDSVRGRIASEWVLADGIFRLRLTIPANCEATVFLPAGEFATITEGGRTLAAAEGVRLLSRTQDRAVVAVGSGHYAFSVQQRVRR
jgi:alpha-L-rhamnosidase